MGEARRTQRRRGRAAYRDRACFPPARRQRAADRHAEHHARPPAVAALRRRQAMTWSRVLIVRRATRLEELIARFNTKPQARFYIESAGGDFADYAAEDAAYRQSLDEVERAVRPLAKVQLIDRGLLPNYLFAEDELVVAVGQDGLVANTAKYALARPIVGVNPEPSRYDGVLLPFDAHSAVTAVRAVLGGTAPIRQVSMAAARLNDGQHLLAFNDFFIGVRTHVSARYRIAAGGREE